METERDHKIQTYIDNQMSVEERLAFEVLMDKDVELKKEVNGLMELNSHLLAAGHDSFKAEVNQWEQKYVQRQRRTKVFSILAIAASVAVVFFIAKFYINESSLNERELYAGYFTPYQDMILSRGETVDNESILFKGMTAYNDQNYAVAAELLEQYRINNKSDKATALYLAISQTELGRFEPAKRNFEIAIQEPLFSQQAEWYLALMYIKKGDHLKAQNVLKSISNNSYHYKSAIAAELYPKLNR